ncbi:MAG: hypothetical protein C0468_02390, partial [Planctomyces sp.]|nr:hypothetical protein [Planctomyces sp.]
FNLNSINSSGQDFFASNATLTVTLVAPPGPAGCTVADVADFFGLTVADGGGPDGVLDDSDFGAFLAAFSAGTVEVADIADFFGLTTEDGGGPDGSVDDSDFGAFLADFAAFNPDCQ